MYVYSVFLLSLPWAPQLSWDVPVDVGFLCEKAAIICVVTKERPCIMLMNHTFNFIRNLSVTFFQDVYHIIQSCT